MVFALLRVEVCFVVKKRLSGFAEEEWGGGVGARRKYYPSTLLPICRVRHTEFYRILSKSPPRRDGGLFPAGSGQNNQYAVTELVQTFRTDCI